MSMELKKEAYAFADGVSCFLDKNDYVRIRWGIWNHQEVVIDMTGDSENIKQAMWEIVEKIKKVEVIDYAEVYRKHSVPQDDQQKISSNMVTLINEGLIVRSDDLEKMRMQVRLLVGKIPDETVLLGRNVLLFGDNEELENVLVSMLEKCEVRVERADKDVTERLKKEDFFTQTDGYATIMARGKYASVFQSYDIIVGAFISPHIVFMRNLNRLLIEQKRAFVFGFLDGPFLMVGSIYPPHTACWECIELALLSHLNDHLSYYKFASEQEKYHRQEYKFTPLIYTLASFISMEALMLARTGLGKLMNRLLSIYIPLLEIQVQSPSRVPYCPACGTLAKMKAKELYFSSRKIIEDVVEKVQINDEERR